MIASIAWLQSALSFFLSRILICSGCSQIFEFFHPIKGTVISLYIVTWSCILILTNKHNCNICKNMCTGEGRKCSRRVGQNGEVTGTLLYGQRWSNLVQWFVASGWGQVHCWTGNVECTCSVTSMCTEKRSMACALFLCLPHGLRVRICPPLLLQYFFPPLGAITPF
jgi:hypothetical protein